MRARRTGALYVLPMICSSSGTISCKYVAFCEFEETSSVVEARDGSCARGGRCNGSSDIRSRAHNASAQTHCLLFSCRSAFVVSSDGHSKRACQPSPTFAVPSKDSFGHISEPAAPRPCWTRKQKVAHYLFAPRAPVCSVSALGSRPCCPAPGWTSLIPCAQAASMWTYTAQ